ncbi:metallophosphoesterase family protein [Tuwongella immobilis]|uniref:Calcineurin-like phosphoesterase domain-containing protein n=1 Tax=Tuwongella immobilis TaxID=692036 RepID=A0A6C2YT90_9BACT|nr:metallophosphoesterase [Tuwongella immobilis]VIP04930.1 metallophosphoesterase : Uncharacterized protein OS=Zhouia amylolytica AD3 GN=P278_02410 PE=4 SV=1: Metallophos [Tuwongella immobilis]VTS07218.1 metallophosphoesterase : Uncharacterized protein OS=Zhouia amylolytica AD3 GN=P278_02410 PE=4 SV=1: Metallophos [Tuwongella immobilis]
MTAVSRRHFGRMLGGLAAGWTLTRPLWPTTCGPRLIAAPESPRREPISLGLIADLHQDIMHDAPARLDAFLSAMADAKPDALLQLGDFAVPAAKNRPLIQRFNQAHANAWHVIGNHDTDGGYRIPELLDAWQMPKRFYAVDLKGIRLLILDGNDRPPNHRAGYPAHIGPEQQEWLRAELRKATTPILLVSHQPLAGHAAVDNAAEIRAILKPHAGKILLAINGHTHLDALVEVDGIPYWHVNSASYFWVGSPYQHNSYDAAIHKQHRWIASTCPYRDALYSRLTIDLDAGTLTIHARSSEWVGDSPAKLGVPKVDGGREREPIAPQIRARKLQTAPRLQ